MSKEHANTPADPRDLPLAVTMGDPAGIGLDIILLAWNQRNTRRLPPFALLADIEALGERARQLNLNIALRDISDILQAAETFKSALPVIHQPLATKCRPGAPDTKNAPAILRSIETATQLVAHGQASAIVTNPIAKSVLYAAGFDHPGHTEYLAHLSKLHYPDEPATPVMMLACDELRVVPATIHIPLRNVPTALTSELIEATVRITADALKTRFGIDNPRIALTGLNPHAGENGTLGSEENDTIIPAIEKLRDEGLNVTGPHPADTMFHEAARQSYDAAVAMYHDQALIPIKTLAFDRGVNTTLGLPFVRTSPDHGTAFDIAGKGSASPESLIASLRLAAQMASPHQSARKP